MKRLLPAVSLSLIFFGFTSLNDKNTGSWKTDKTCITTSLPAEMRINAGSITKNSATISWENSICNQQFIEKCCKDLNKTVINVGKLYSMTGVILRGPTSYPTADGKQKSISLSSLMPGTTYTYQIVSSIQGHTGVLCCEPAIYNLEGTSSHMGGCEGDDTCCKACFAPESGSVEFTTAGSKPHCYANVGGQIRVCFYPNGCTSNLFATCATDVLSDEVIFDNGMKLNYAGYGLPIGPLAPGYCITPSGSKATILSGHPGVVN